MSEESKATTTHKKWKKTLAEGFDVDYCIVMDKKLAEIFLTRIEEEITYFDGDLAKIKIFGKWHPIPRQQVSFGDAGLSYKFSGNTIPALPWPDVITELRTLVEKATGFSYNFVLVNKYRDGNDYIGEHKDDEKELDDKIPIASLSLGAKREFVFKHMNRKGKHKRDVPLVKMWLESGSLLLMNPPTNKYWYHSLPKRKSFKEVRINLTFRKMDTSDIT